MTTSKHTPTPWYVESTRYGPYVSSETDMVVAECSQRCGNKPREQADANAALIVRAVNAHDAMVAALETLVREWDLGREPLASDWSKARSALRAAKGE